VEHLPRKHKALSSNSSTTKKKKKERKKEGGREGKERKGKEEGKEGRKEKEREFTSWDCGTCLSLWPWDDPHTPTQKKKKKLSSDPRLMPVILTTKEAEIRRIAI
jgi:chromatin remodeling complex protein RSC6